MAAAFPKRAPGDPRQQGISEGGTLEPLSTVHLRGGCSVQLYLRASPGACPPALVNRAFRRRCRQTLYPCGFQRRCRGNALSTRVSRRLPGTPLLTPAPEALSGKCFGLLLRAAGARGGTADAVGHCRPFRPIGNGFDDDHVTPSAIGGAQRGIEAARKSFRFVRKQAPGARRPTASPA